MLTAIGFPVTVAHISTNCYPLVRSVWVVVKSSRWVTELVSLFVLNFDQLDVNCVVLSVYLIVILLILEVIALWRLELIRIWCDNENVAYFFHEFGGLNLNFLSWIVEVKYRSEDTTVVMLESLLLYVMQYLWYVKPIQ